MLIPEGTIPVPPYASSEFDHGDVEWASGRVFVAHTQTGTVEVLDGPNQKHVVTIPDCPEASGVLVAQQEGLVFAAARGAGRVVVVEAASSQVLNTIAVDPRPNGLAWDRRRQHLLVADVQENTARLVTSRGELVALSTLPGRPRWCVYDAAQDRFLVNIREPASVVILDAANGNTLETWPVSSAGPHGLDLDAANEQAFIACDGGEVLRVNLLDGRVTGHVAIDGVPDALWCNEKQACLYVAIGDPGIVQVIDARTMDMLQTLVTEPGAHTTAFDPRRQLLYVFLPTTCQAGIYRASDGGDHS